VTGRGRVQVENRAVEDIVRCQGITQKKEHNIQITAKV